MNRYVCVALAGFISISVSGCGSREQVMEEPADQLSMETLSTLGNETQIQATSEIPVMNQTQASVPAAASLEPLPPSGPYKPSTREIQTALKNAGYYTGAIDGKIGPMTKKATEDFQNAKGLKADGKVGPKTWAVLGSYLTTGSAPKTKGSKR